MDLGKSVYCKGLLGDEELLLVTGREYTTDKIKSFLAEDHEYTGNGIVYGEISK